MNEGYVSGLVEKTSPDPFTQIFLESGVVMLTRTSEYLTESGRSQFLSECRLPGGVSFLENLQGFQLVPALSQSGWLTALKLTFWLCVTTP